MRNEWLDDIFTFSASGLDFRDVIMVLAELINAESEVIFAVFNIALMLTCNSQNSIEGYQKNKHKENAYNSRSWSLVGMCARLS